MGIAKSKLRTSDRSALPDVHLAEGDTSTTLAARPRFLDKLIAREVCTVDSTFDNLSEFCSLVSVPGVADQCNENLCESNLSVDSTESTSRREFCAYQFGGSSTVRRSTTDRARRVGVALLVFILFGVVLNNMILVCRQSREARGKNARVAISPKVQAQRCFDRGLVFSHNNDYEAALAKFGESIRLYPTPEAYNMQGLMRSKLGRYTSAISDFSTACSRGFPKASIIGIVETLMLGLQKLFTGINPLTPHVRGERPHKITLKQLHYAPRLGSIRAEPTNIKS